MVMDAVRISDGIPVVIKRIKTGSTELDICRYFSSDERSRDADNYCVPILDEFTDDSDPSTHLIIMPLLRQYNDPHFYFVDEVLDFVKQTLKVNEHSCLGHNHTEYSYRGLLFFINTMSLIGKFEIKPKVMFYVALLTEEFFIGTVPPETL